MAHAAVPGDLSIVHDHQSVPRASDDRLLKSALKEAQRLELRRRLLPQEVLCDRGWLVMLDLFACELSATVIGLSTGRDRWGLSESTATRQIAGLIASGLVRRRSSSSGSGTTTLELTDYGSSIMRQILSTELWEL